MLISTKVFGKQRVESRPQQRGLFFPSTLYFLLSTALAEEWRKRMQIKGFPQADLARELGVSRARVTQVMNVLKLSKSRLDDLRALGDPMTGSRMTERMLRKTC